VKNTGRGILTRKHTKTQIKAQDGFGNFVPSRTDAKNRYAFSVHRRNLLKYGPALALTLLEEEPGSPNADDADTVIQCELISIRTPGFDRNSTRKIIEPEI
jgi:hypothetical protein